MGSPQRTYRCIQSTLCQAGGDRRHDFPRDALLRFTTIAVYGASENPSPAYADRCGDEPRPLCRLGQRCPALYHAHIDLRSACDRPPMISPTVPLSAELPYDFAWGYFFNIRLLDPFYLVFQRHHLPLSGIIMLMIARRVESLCCLRIRIGQNCPKTPRISYYHGTMACSSMLRLTIASDYGG